MVQQRFGVKALKVNGQQLRVRDGTTYNLGLPKREPVMGPDGVHGHKETQQAPFVKGSISDGSDMDLQALGKTTTATITLELLNGKVVLLREATVDIGDVNPDDGSVPFEAYGVSADEIS